MSEGVLSNDPSPVEPHLEAVSGEPSAGKDEIGIHRQPELGDPSEVDP